MKRYHISAIFFIIILIPVIYLNTFNVPFQFDDSINIGNIKPIHITTLSISALKGVILNKAAIRRPVTNITFALNYYFGELDVFGYHLVNIIIHIITAIAIYLFLYDTIKIGVQGAGCRVQGSFQIPGLRDRSFWIAFIATLLWATSPVQTQAVTYIVQRATSMATMFYMLSLLCYVKGRIILGVSSQEPGARSKGRLDGLLASGFWLLASLFFALLAFGTKEISATLPLVIILYEIYFFARFDPRSIRRISLYIGILASLFVVIGLIYIGGDGIIEGIKSLTSGRTLQQRFTAATRLITEFRVVVYYITLLILPLPSRLRVVYEFPVSHSLFDPVNTSICMVILISLIGYGIYICKKRPIISFFILWFFINLAIESTVIRLWLVFEHRLYLPSIGFFVIIAIGIVKLFDLVKCRIKSSNHNYLLLTSFFFILTCLILMQSIWTYQRNLVWGDVFVMLRDNLEKEPDSSDIHFLLGSLYQSRKEMSLAIKEYKDAVRIDPDYSSAYFRLGRVYEEIGETDKAIKQYEESIRSNPTGPISSAVYFSLGSLYYDQGKTDKAIRLYKIVKRITQDNRYVYPYVHLGEIYKDQGRWEMAINEYKSAIEISPEDPLLYNEVGLLYKKTGRTDLSIEQYQKALAIDPDFSDGHYNLGLIFFEQNNFDKALNKFKEALRGNPDYSAAHYNIGVIYYEQGKIESAIREYKKTLEIEPDNPEASYNLAYALESTGKIEDAISYYERFLEIAERDKYKKFIEKTRGRLRRLKRD